MNLIRLGESILESLYGTDDAIAHDGVLGMEWYKHKFGEYQEQAKYATKQTISTIQPVEKDAKSSGKSTVSVKVAKGATPNLEALSSKGSSKSSGSQTTTTGQVMRKPREQIYKETYDRVYAQLTGKLPNVDSAVKVKNTSKSDNVEDFGADHAAAKQRMQEINETGGYYYNQLDYTDKKQHNTVKVIDKSTAEKLLRPSEFQRQSEAIKEAQKKASKAKSLKGSHTNAEIAKMLGVSESSVSYYLSHSDDSECIAHDGRTGMHWYKHAFGKWQNHAQYANGKSDPNENSKDTPAIGKEYVTRKNPDGTTTKDEYMAPTGVYKGGSVKTNPTIYKLPGGNIVENYGNDFESTLGRLKELNQTGSYCGVWQGYKDDPKKLSFYVYPLGGDKEFAKTTLSESGIATQSAVVEQATQRASKAKSLQGSHTIAEIAKILGVSESAVSYYLSK